MIALLVVGYFIAALVGVYLEARLTGDSMAPLWIIWPILLPILLVAAAFEAVAALGEDHHG